MKEMCHTCFAFLIAVAMEFDKRCLYKSRWRRKVSGQTDCAHATAVGRKVQIFKYMSLLSGGKVLVACQVI
jgi:hypothetical protein